MGLDHRPVHRPIMASLPLDKAGVGSAVNDTTRELGGALGVAILGSIVTSVYKGGLDVSQLPAQAADIARQSVGAAIQVASMAPDAAAGEAFAAAARTAFTDAFSAAMFVAAAVALAAAIMVRTFGIGTVDHEALKASGHA